MTRRISAAALRRLAARPLFKVAMAALSVLCAAPSDCGGGSSGSGNSTNNYSIPDQTTEHLIGGASAIVTPTFDVDRIIRQAINEATARGRPATIAVVDRVGNVLAVVQMSGAPSAGNFATNGVVTCPATAQAAPLPAVQPCVMVDSGRGVNTGLGGVLVPSTLAAISKAITGAFLSSGGNAFSTRTASQIVQEHFNPGTRDAPGGPLFGVQFSQLPCSDFNQYLLTLGGARANVAGPQRSPLGLSADPGGLPIYKNGVMVGGIGVVANTKYTLDLNVDDFDQNTPAGDDDEIIALAGVSGYEAPGPIQAQNISAGGLTLRYVDATSANFASPVLAAASPFPAGGGPSAVAARVSVTGYYTAGAAPTNGTTWGSAAAGVFPDGFLGGGTQYNGVDAWTFLDPTTGVERVPRNGYVPAAGFITSEEARQIVISGLQVAVQSRGQIRIPTNSFAEVTVSVVDLDGNVLAMARSPDAPVFGADVSLQKARSVVWFSRVNGDTGSAFNEIRNLTAPDLNTFVPSTKFAGAPYTGTFADYANAVSLGAPSLFNSGTAFSDRALGDLARPFYPDGQNPDDVHSYVPAGPLSLPFGDWSPFSTGVQLDLVLYDIAFYGLFGGAPPVAGCGNGSGGATRGAASNALPVNDPGGTVTQPLNAAGQTVEPKITQLANGLQIFPGGVPLYRGGVLVGAVGVSGDGVQQDDMVSYLSIQNLNGLDGLTNAASNIRADQLPPLSSGPDRLTYIQCPVAPFLTSRVQNAC